MVVHHGYVTLVWSHMHWSSQKCLEVLVIGTNVMHNFSVRPLYNKTYIWLFLYQYLLFSTLWETRDGKHVIFPDWDPLRQGSYTGCLQSSSDTTCSGTEPEDDFQVTLEMVMMTSVSPLSYRAVPTFEIYIPIMYNTVVATSTCSSVKPAISPSNVAQNTNPGTVLDSARPEDSKTPPTC